LFTTPSGLDLSQLESFSVQILNTFEAPAHSTSHVGFGYI
jgi:hypothetical protein